LIEASGGIISSNGGFCVFLPQEKAKPEVRIMKPHPESFIKTPTDRRFLNGLKDELAMIW
jgi:hypothetical protein